MDVQTRIALCLLLENIRRQEEYCEKIGLSDQSEWKP